MYKYYNRKTNINPDYFINVNTPESAYLLGLLWADGCVRKNNYHYNIDLSIITKDYKSIAKLFNYFGKWTIYKRQRKNRQEQTIIKTSNKRLFDFLVSKDYKIKSITSPHKILSIIPDNLKHYWFRGYSDGDGCFCFSKPYNRRFSFSGDYNTNWRCIRKIFAKYKYILQKRILKKHKNSTIFIYRKSDILNWGSYLYKNYTKDHIGYPRKYDKWKSMFEYNIHYNAKNFNLPKEHFQ